MEVREGYKQTEIGLIPEDWRVETFGNIVNYIKGYAFKSAEYSSSGIRIIRVSDTTFNSIKDTDAVYLPVDLATHYKRWELQENDLIFSTVGSKPPMYDSLVGKSIIVTKKHSGSLLNQNAVLIRTKDYSKDRQQLLLNHFKTTRYIQYIEQIYRGNANQASITLKELFKYTIPLPIDKHEQTAIAQALTDVDALIDALQKLIDKKHHIKQGAMQDLLSGKKRLKGFKVKSGYKQTEIGNIPEDWDIYSIIDFTDVTAGGTPSTLVSEYWNGDIPWMSSGELHLKNVYDVQERITNIGLKNSSTKLIPSNCILIGLAGQGKTRGTVAINRIPLCTNQSIAAIYPNENYISDYLYHYLDSQYKELRMLSTGDGGRGGLNLTIIRNIKIPFPTKEEQKAIAIIFTDMDKEIEALETKLDKTKQLKEGMMHELLTGRIRLI